VVPPGSSRDFFGPIDPNEIQELLAADGAEEERASSSRHRDPWRLPLSHQARALLGDRLAALGDRRLGVALREDGLPDIDWCLIEGGTVTIEMEKKEITQNVMPFSMARYPVTIDQFRAFLEECYRDGRWEVPTGFPTEHLERRPAHVGRYGNYPADLVSWYDAMAFCHWLSARLRAEVRLPTEFEWQLAATGGDPTNIWPWGARWEPARQPWRANTGESGLDRSTAVGLYPLGASRAGLLDMAGNIRECCQNAFDDPDDIGFPDKGGGPRVVRGGSWLYSQADARCAARAQFLPGIRNAIVGFRVVSSLPIVDR
jgi:formylglycine-generating enzyme required for sulfatase activity